MNWTEIKERIKLHISRIPNIDTQRNYLGLDSFEKTTKQQHAHSKNTGNGNQIEAAKQ